MTITIHQNSQMTFSKDMFVIHNMLVTLCTASGLDVQCPLLFTTL